MPDAGRRSVGHRLEVADRRLTRGERDRLAGVLRTLLAPLDAAQPDPSDWGLAVAPAHVARWMRPAVGSPDVTGLLVRDVDPNRAAGLLACRHDPRRRREPARTPVIPR